jgi:hypothetical protein
MPTVAAVYAAYEAKQESGYRDHLGASLIGTECDRALWYSFRWATRARHAGRLLRLFESGHLAETRLMSDLRAAGVTVYPINQDTGRQWEVRAVQGHFGGSMDGVGVGFVESSKWHVIELKTHNAKSFAALLSKGVQASKPRHWAQCQTYMHLAELDRAFYLAVNKDTDELYQERIHYDAAAALKIVARAESIIMAPQPPMRISGDPAWYQCRFCEHHAVCHDGKLPEPHCRSCLHSSPAEEGCWHCASRGAAIDPEQQRKGCVRHLYIPGMVKGEQIDAGPDWVSYRMPDGSTWRDTVVPF